jgi:hypothetical protein
MTRANACGALGCQCGSGPQCAIGITCTNGSCGGVRTWTQITIANPPAARYAHGLAYDSVRHKTVMFGGSNGTVNFGDTWEYDGTTWTQVATTGPSARGYVSMEYDPIGQRTLMYGGSTVANAFLGDMWSWNGTTWTQLTPALLPPARAWGGMVYDSVRQRMVMQGGQNSAFVSLSDTWEFNVTTNTWTQNTTAGTPAARAIYREIAYDPGRQRTVFFGGYNGGVNVDTWQYDGSTWSQITTTGAPPAMWAGAMSYDPASQSIALTGGNTNSGVISAMWLFSSGTTWTSNAGPSMRGWHAMTYDSFRGKLVVFGGWNSAPINDTWEY